MHFLFPLVFCIGCNIGGLDFEDIEGSTLNGTIAVPLGEMQYTVRDFMDIADGQLKFHEDDCTSMLIMIYRDTVAFGNVGEIVQIGDVENTVSIHLPVTPAADSSQVIALRDTLIFSYLTDNQEQLDSIFHKTGSLNLSITKTFPYDLVYKVTIRDIRNKQDDTPAIFDNSVHSLDLSDYKTFLFADKGSNYFTAELELKLVLKPGQHLTSDDAVHLNLEFVNQSFDVIYGKLGRDTLQVSDQVMDLDLFDDVEGLQFASPELSFHFDNSFGLPLQINLNKVFCVKENGTNAGSDTTFLKGAMTGTSPIIEAAGIAGDVRRTSIRFDNSNSNLKTLFNSAPDQIGVDLSTITNPRDAHASNFVDDSSQLTTMFELSIPLEISMDNMVKKGTFENASGLEFDKADSMIIRVIAENELPFSALLELRIIDKDDSVLHVIEDHVELKAPAINEEGLVIEARQSVSDFVIPEKGIALFNEGKKLQLTLIVNTPENGSGDNFVKLLADYKIGLQVSAIGRLKYPIQ